MLPKLANRDFNFNRTLIYGLTIWGLLFNQIYAQKKLENYYSIKFIDYIFKNGRCLFQNNAKHSFDTQHAPPCFPRGLFYPFHNIKEWHGEKSTAFIYIKKFPSCFYSLKREKICPIPFLPLDGSYLKSEK